MELNLSPKLDDRKPKCRRRNELYLATEKKNRDESA